MVRKGTLELLLVRPIPRWRLLVFKYVGSLLFVGALLGLLIFFAWLVTGILANIWSPGIILALPSLLLFFTLLLSVSTFTGVLTRSTLSAMLVTVCYWVVLFILGPMHAQTVDSRIRFENAGKLQKLSSNSRRPNQRSPDSVNAMHGFWSVNQLLIYHQERRYWPTNAVFGPISGQWSCRW